MIFLSYCELGFCPYVDFEDLTCEDCPYWVEDFCPEFDFPDDDDII